MKKFLILCFTAVILLAAVTGSIAYFTDSVVSEENVIASGSIDVLQHEYERVKNADGTYTLRAFTQKQNLYAHQLPSMTRGRLLSSAMASEGRLPWKRTSYTAVIMGISKS